MTISSEPQTYVEQRRERLLESVMEYLEDPCPSCPTGADVFYEDLTSVLEELKQHPMATLGRIKLIQSRFQCQKQCSKV
ncbi:MAG: hypothetical protein ACO24H_06280 [Polynucleobacter sp.]